MGQRTRGPLRGPFFIQPPSGRQMDRVAVFVDAGYLFAQGSVLLTGRKLVRGEIRRDHRKVVEHLRVFAERVTGLPLLRIYWYDGTSTGPTPQHASLANEAGLKLRLGFVNSMGEQKGVDSLIVTDMIALARNRGMAEAVVLSGDEDIRVGVQQAQEFGVRVHLVGIHPSRGSQSLFLLQEADACYEWDQGDLSPFLACVPRETESPRVVEAPADRQGIDPLESVPRSLAEEVTEVDLEGLIALGRAGDSLPREIHGRLLRITGDALGRQLVSSEKRAVRATFLQACEERLAQAAANRVRNRGESDR
ncbi:MAG TPA: NYN domain-containing protein [Longimicrobiaceae bacterium]|nr:NYN domain-containing protein [Longimicrobiaceae bacterium]